MRDKKTLVSGLTDQECWSLCVGAFAGDLAMYHRILSTKVADLGLNEQAEIAWQLSRDFETRRDSLSKHLKAAVLAFAAECEREEV